MNEETAGRLASGISKEVTLSPLFIGLVSKAMLFIFIRCFAVTFSETMDPPHVPGPNVNEGASAVVYPTAPTEATVLTRILNAGFSSANFILMGWSLEWITMLCPM